MAKKQEEYFTNIPFMGLRNIENWMGGFRALGVDPNTMIEVQRRNIEAFGDANRMWVSNMQEMFRKQADMMRKSMEQNTKAIEKMNVSAENPQDTMANQVKLTQNSLENAMTQLRELTEMTAESNSEIMKVLNTRFCDCLEEIQSALHDSAEGMEKEFKKASEDMKEDMKEAVRETEKAAAKAESKSKK